MNILTTTIYGNLRNTLISQSLKFIHFTASQYHVRLFKGSNFTLPSYLGN